MNKDFTNNFIINSLKMPIVTDLHSLSDELALSTRLLYLMSMRSEEFYEEFYIDKKDGSKRKILSPKFSIKLVQKWILHEILEKVSVSEQAMAYVKGKGSSIKKNANYHRYNLYIYELDLKDFFTSIAKDKVFYVFKSIGYNNITSNIFANLCTYEDYLPQGGVCSPALSNIVCRNLDKRLYTLCSNRDITFTRYADDLTFSCDNKVSLLKVMDVINEIISDEGFTINQKKTRLLSPSSHKTVTGLTVNDSKVKVNKAYKKKIRSIIHYMICTKDYSQLDSVRGMISYVSSIEEDYNEKIRKYIGSFYNKSVAVLEDVVLKYNDNKIFPDMEDMMVKEPVYYAHGYNDLDESEHERYSFLSKHGLVVEPKKIIEKCNSFDDDDIPF